MHLPTVPIADATAPGGYRLINESDFNPDEHKRFEGKGVKVPQPETDPSLEPNVPPPTVQPSERLEEMTLTQLRGLAQAEEIKGRTTMDQDELIAALEKKGYRR